MEIFIFGAIIIFVLVYNHTIDKNKFIDDNKELFQLLKEDDYDFLVSAKYGDRVSPYELFNQRLFLALAVSVFVLVVFLSNINILNIVLSLVVAYLVFKMPYRTLKNYYKRHLHEIDVMLPYYLKGLEILIQHYTVPVALAKSIPDAPSIFKPGLKRLIAKIDAGDPSIDPYMDFANEYPVRDSMRMMRLLYRLGIGSQERKQERLLMFSRTVSSLQNKAREQKYKKRLDFMESQTMIMLVVTGGGVMILILFALVTMFSNTI